MVWPLLEHCLLIVNLPHVEKLYGILGSIKKMMFQEKSFENSTLKFW